MKLLSFGEIIWDNLPTGKKLGGAPLNFAAHSALLGADAVLVSAVGSDPLGKEALGMIRDKLNEKNFYAFNPAFPNKG